MAVVLPLLMAMLMCATLQSSAVVSPNKYTVGSSKGWNPGVNYTVWAKQYHFYVGDWLVFLYKAGEADVLQVNETAYNQCLSDSPISNWSRGRSYAFELNNTGHYYFICSLGYCYNGMKLAIKSEPLPPPSPPPSSQPSAASDPLFRRNLLLPRSVANAVAVSAALLWWWV